MMEFTCKDCNAWRCLTFQEMLEHHFQMHEKYVPQSVLDRVHSEETIIGFPNTKDWISIQGDIHKKID